MAGDSLLSFNRERPVIRLGADRETGTRSRHNHLNLNRVLPSTGYEERPQVELSEGTEANLVVLPLAAGAAARRAVRDHGSDNQNLRPAVSTRRHRRKHPVTVAPSTRQAVALACRCSTVGECIDARAG